MGVTQDKFIAKSKTVQGLVVMALPMIATLAGFEWAGEDNAALNETIDAVITAVGLIWALIGRVTATTGVKWTP